MNSSYQDVYAKHLHQACAPYGYPLRVPEPMNTLPEWYRDEGLQIGDVGVVDSDGAFDVLFNVCRRDDHALHDVHGVPNNFDPVKVEGCDIKVIDHAISSGPIRSHGIMDSKDRYHDEPRPISYEFDTSSAAGAILVLPHGAKSVQHKSPGQFRELAEERALDWYEFARKRYHGQRLDRSLYLITGFYKTRSWSLGSFNNPTDTPGKIFVERDRDNSNSYVLRFTFTGDCRSSPGTDNDNQTVFITGFRITIGNLLQEPVVLGVTESETFCSTLLRLFRSCLRRLRGTSSKHRPRALINVEHSPPMSQPFHPSDTINRLLLHKNPNARVAVTHDNDWMEMMKKGLTHNDFLRVDQLESILTQHFIISVDSERENTTVFLRRKADGFVDSASSTADSYDSSPDLEMLDSPTSEFEVSSPSTPMLEISTPTTPELEVSFPLSSESEYSSHTSLDNPSIVITRTCFRAQNIPSGLSRIPVGFYVLVQFNGVQRRTQIKSVLLDDTSIEWDDEIPLPAKAVGKVLFTVYASFELEPVLGNGELLYRSETPIEELMGGTHLIPFSAGGLVTATTAIPSLLITFGRWYSDYLAPAPSSDNSELDSEEFLDFVRETDLGREALLRYHNAYRREDLENVVRHFDYALRICPSHRSRPVALVNLANAKFLSYQTDQTSAEFAELIQLYQEALHLRHPGHPDRPATLLNLAQTLLFRCEKQGYNKFDADEISKLINEPQAFSANSHERRAADLVLETLQRCRVVNSGQLTELNDLVPTLEHSVMVPPDGYFDRPHRMINLSTTLWRRHKKCGCTSDLDRSFEMNEQAFQLLPAGHPDKLYGLRVFGAVLWRLIGVRRDFSYLTKLTKHSEEALQFIPEGHSERQYLVICSSGQLFETSEDVGDTAVEAEEYDEAITHYTRAIELLTALVEVFPQSDDRL